MQTTTLVVGKVNPLSRQVGTVPLNKGDKFTERMRSELGGRNPRLQSWEKEPYLVLN